MNKNLLGGREKRSVGKNKKISTHLLTVLITSVIVRLEQRKKRKFTSTLFLFGANVSTKIDKEEADYEYQ